MNGPCGKEILRQILPAVPGLMLVDHIEASGVAFLDAVANRVQELEGGADLPVGLVGTLQHLEVMQKELADLVFTELLGGTSEEGNELLAVEEIVCGG
jgi:hypothetical protein